MKTLKDYVKGYGFIPIEMVAEYKSNGVRYSLCKESVSAVFFFMKDEEVVFHKHILGDKFPKLAIEHFNHKDDQSIIEKIYECESYKLFKNFIKKETGEDFKL